MRRLKYLLLPILFLLLTVYQVIAQDANGQFKGVPYRLQEEPNNNKKGQVIMPVYSNGYNEMLNFIAKNLKYPDDAIKDKVEGRVIVKFTISKDGNVTNVLILRSVHPSLDEEAMRVVSIMPKWTPGKIDGKLADIEYTLPFNFTLPGAQNKNESMKVSIIADKII